MDDDESIIVDFINCNRKEMARYIRGKLLAANAKPYLDTLGKEGIDALDREAAGVLLDLACAMLRRVHPDRDCQPESILARLPEDLRQSIHLPRSEEYYAVLSKLKQSS